MCDCMCMTVCVCDHVSVGEGVRISLCERICIVCLWMCVEELAKYSIVKQMLNLTKAIFKIAFMFSQ